MIMPSKKAQQLNNIINASKHMRNSFKPKIVCRREKAINAREYAEITYIHTAFFNVYGLQLKLNY